jgi:TPR repeat protein
MYLHGKGTKHDKKKAFFWFKKAAMNGSITSAYDVGLCLERGEGVQRDRRAALRWYRRAASGGSVLGQLAMGIAYRDGTGVRRNKRKAKYWLAIAAVSGDRTAMRYLLELSRADERMRRRTVASGG